MGLFGRKRPTQQQREPIPSGWVGIVNGLLEVRDWLDPDVFRHADGSLYLWVKASPITGLLVSRRTGKWWITPAGFGPKGEPVSIGSYASPVCHEDSPPERVVQAILADVAKALHAYLLAYDAGNDIPEVNALWVAMELRALEDAGLVPRFSVDLEDN